MSRYSPKVLHGLKNLNCSTTMGLDNYYRIQTAAISIQECVLSKYIVALIKKLRIAQYNNYASAPCPV